MRRLWTDIVQPAQAVIVDMHLRGIRVDEAARQELLAEAHKEKEILADVVLGAAAPHVSTAMPAAPLVEVCRQHPDFMGATPRNVRGAKRCGACVAIYETMRDWRGSAAVKKAKRLADFNPASRDQVGWLLYEKLEMPVIERTEETGRPRVSLSVLEELLEHSKTPEEHLPLLEKLIALAHVQHRISVDLEPIVVDGRTHPVYSLDATAIGRNRSGKQSYDYDKTDETGFNMQNVPEEVRRIYVADPGHQLIGADASQIEWVMMMLQAHCKEGVEAYAQGRDVHTENARDIVVPVLMQEEWERLSRGQQKERRGQTKSFTHGLDYGEGDPNLARRFRVERKRAKAARDAYFAKWPDIGRWHQQIEQTVLQQRALRNPFGRQRRFLDITAKRKGGVKVLTLDRKQLKEALAFGPASANGDLWKINARKLYDAGMMQLAGTHDDHLLQEREGRVAECAARVKELCEQNVPELAELMGAGQWCPRFDVRVGGNWAPAHEHGKDCEGAECDEAENKDGLRKVA